MTAWIFAAAAVAYLVWANRTPAAVSLAPLSPPGLPTLAQAPRPGVSPLLLAAILLPWGLLAWTKSVQPPTPAPGPAPSVGLDLRWKFTGEAAATDAAMTAALLDALADAISHDGTLQPPRLTTGTQLAELRAISREYRTSGVSLGQRQPLARDAIKAYLDAEVGTDGGPVDAAGRARWVTAFRGVATAARAAIGR